MIPKMVSFVVGLFLCARSQSVAFGCLQKCIKSWKMQFPCECCPFLHSRAQVFNAAIAPNATRSRCFAAGVYWFPEFTLGELLVFNTNGHHSAVKRPLWPDPWHCRCLPEAHDLNSILGWHLVAQFAAVWLPRLLQIRLLVSMIGVK